jgi:hypothetical protein
MNTVLTTGVAAGACLGCGHVNAAAQPPAATVTRCGGCGHRVLLTWVRGIHNDTVPCDARCQYAVGPACSCSCGGRNHRRGYIDPGLVPAYIRERDAQRHADRLARAAAKSAAARAAHADRMAALLETYPILEGLLDGRYDGDTGFMGDMRTALERGAMTDRQITAAENALERDAARERTRAERDAERAALAATGVVLAEGRRVLEGEIVRVSHKESHFGHHEKTIWQITVRLADGCQVMGTLPADLRPTSYTGGGLDDQDSWQWHMARLAGRTVAFIATVARSTRDVTFGFYTRPAKARFTA